MDRFINVNSHSRDDLNQARSGSDFGPNYPVLGGRYVVYEEIYTTVQESVDEVLTCLVPGVDYEADELIGHSLWDDMTPTGKREMLISLKHLASLPNSPLKLSDSGVRGKGRTLFQLRTPEEMAA